jgi:hypothetical protein
MECKLGTVRAQARKEVTVQVTADGKNFADTTRVTEILANTAVATCSTNSMDATPNPTCLSKDKASILVSVGGRIHG